MRTPTQTPTTGQKFAAEVLGTFVLVFFGCGAAVISGGDYVATALAFGLTVLVMAYAVGRISGGHFNPAVAAGRRPRRPDAVEPGRTLHRRAAASARCWPALALFSALHGFEGFIAEGNMGQNFFGDQGPASPGGRPPARAADDRRLRVGDPRRHRRAQRVNVALGPLAIGLSLAMIHFASISLTGTSVNPARSIGVGVFAGTDAIVQLWLFVLAPLLGAAIAGLTYPVLFGHGADAGGRLGPQLRRRPGGPVRARATTRPSGTRASRPAGASPGPRGALPRSSSGASRLAVAAPAAAAARPGLRRTAVQQPGQWGQPAPHSSRPSPVSPSPASCGAPPAARPQPAARPARQPGHWGNPDGDDDGRTQVRRPD